MVTYPFPIPSLSTSCLPFYTYTVHVLIFTTASTRKTMFVGHNVHTNRLGLYFALQGQLNSLYPLSKMLVKFCVKADHNYLCT